MPFLLGNFIFPLQGPANLARPDKSLTGLIRLHEALWQLLIVVSGNRSDITTYYSVRGSNEAGPQIVVKAWYSMRGRTEAVPARHVVKNISFSMGRLRGGIESGP